MRKAVQLLALAIGCWATSSRADLARFSGALVRRTRRSAWPNQQHRLPLHWSDSKMSNGRPPFHFAGGRPPLFLAPSLAYHRTLDGHDFSRSASIRTREKFFLIKRFSTVTPPNHWATTLTATPRLRPVIEAGRVYVHFGSYGTACLDTATFRIIWKRDDLPCRHFRAGFIPNSIGQSSHSHDGWN